MDTIMTLQNVLVEFIHSMSSSCKFPIERVFTMCKSHLNLFINYSATFSIKTIYNQFNTQWGSDFCDIRYMSLRRDFQYVGVGLCQVDARTINGFLNH